jgi:hypothetical protein
MKTVMCLCCKRDVHMNRASTWNRDGRICRDCISLMWREIDGGSELTAFNFKIIGNRVRMKQGLPPMES